MLFTTRRTRTREPLAVGKADRILRYRMEADLRRLRLRPFLTPEFRLVPWSTAVGAVETLAARHAAAKHAAFRGERDAEIFPCFRTTESCLDLMRRIVRRPNFLPKATWLARRVDGLGPADLDGDVGTIQGLRLSPTIGAVQNVGVVPAARGCGVARALLLRAMIGFRDSGLSRASLEVTATNHPAVELYRSIGFRIVRTTERLIPSLAEA